MRKIGGEYLVAKKSLLKKALEEFDFKDKRIEFEGEMGLVFGDGESMTSASKQLRDFSRGHKLKILGGILENKYIDEAVVRQLAEIPSREILLSQFVRAVASPLQQLVGVLQAPMRELVNALSQIKN
jgi:large subunit ribosomal protein L10